MMNSNILSLITLAFFICLANFAFAQQEDPTLFLSRANARIAKVAAFPSAWEGPKTGPAISATKKLIVLIGSDQKNGTLSTLSNGIKEAADVAGWDFYPIDCYGIKKQRVEAFSRAMALKPIAIILAGIDASDQQKEIQTAAAKKIPVIGWHASATAGPTDGLFTNITSDPKEAAQIAALFSIIDANGKLGVVIMGDPANQYSMVKTNEVANLIKQCAACNLLGIEEVPLSVTPEKMKGVLESLVKRHGKKWTHVIAINDAYLDVIATPSVAVAIVDQKLHFVSAGDGTAAAYQRIKKSMQIGTVPEPVGLQGWQLVDEINRAIAGQKPSGYTTPVYLVTKQNLSFHGGQGNAFEPNNGYRAMYKRIWQKN